MLFGTKQKETNWARGKWLTNGGPERCLIPFQEVLYLTDINISYVKLREEMWNRLEPYWTKKYKETVLTTENIVLTWENNVPLTENKDGTGPKFIRKRFFDQGGKKKAVSISPHQKVVPVRAVVPLEIVELAEHNREQAELRENDTVLIRDMSYS